MFLSMLVHVTTPFSQHCMYIYRISKATLPPLQGLTNDFKDALDKLDHENLLQLARQDVSSVFMCSLLLHKCMCILGYKNHSVPVSDCSNN